MEPHHSTIPRIGTLRTILLLLTILRFLDFTIMNLGIVFEILNFGILIQIFEINNIAISNLGNLAHIFDFQTLQFSKLT